MSFLTSEKVNYTMGNKQCLPQHNYIPPKQIEEYEDRNPGDKTEYLEGMSFLLVV